ncbi:MAG TPA: tripartite tricarboxylate transporter substrate binding protein [Ramlibacter sp.]|nr:tripartite tricarboxylate transporter substrate binding protein [Ramlibacter sp.]
MPISPVRFVTTLFRAFGACALAAAAVAAAAAEPFPSKPIRIVIPAAAGGSLDITARLVAQKMGEKLGQSVIVDNRPGGETLLGTRLVKDAPPDGYTLIGQASGFTLFPFMRSDTGYDALKDFAPVGIMLRAPRVVVVSTEKPYRNLPDFIAAAKGGQLTYGSGGVGTPSHIAMESFAQALGLRLTNIPFRGTGAALPEVAAGRVDVMFDAISSSRSYIEGGKLRPLAVSSDKRVPLLPDVPTITEQGVPYTNVFWLGLLAPAGTPRDVVQKLADAMKAASDSPDLRARFQADGSDPTHVGPQEFGAFLRKEAGEMSTLSTILPKQ